MHWLHSKRQSLRCTPGWGNPGCCIVTPCVGEGSEREQCCLLGSLLAFGHFPCYPQANWALLVMIPGWVGLCTFQDPGGLSNELSCETGSFSCCRRPHRCFPVRGFEALFPCTGALGCVVSLTPQLFLSVYLQADVGPPVLPASASPLPRVLSTQLPISAPPTGLDECFFSIQSCSDFHTVQFSGSYSYFLF